MADLNYSDYGKATDALFAAMDKTAGTAAVFALGKNGEGPIAQQFTDSAAASSAYDVLVNAPTDRWYLALYDSAKSATPNGRVDETYLGGIAATHVEVKKISKPWLGKPLAAVAIFGGLSVFAGRKRHRR